MEKCLTCGLPTRIEVPIEGSTVEFIDAVYEAMTPIHACPASTARATATCRDIRALAKMEDADTGRFYVEPRFGADGSMSWTFLGLPLVFVDGPEIAGRLVLMHY